MEPSLSLDTLSDDLHSISSNSTTTTPITSTSSSTTTTTKKHTHTPSAQTITLQDIHFLKKLGSGDISSVYQAILTKPQFVSTLHFQCHDYIIRSIEKCLEGNLDVPRTWLASQEIIRFRYLKDSEVESEASVNPDNAITYVDNTKDVDMPMQVNDEQMDIILSRKSSFIIGRSRTRKTNILTMKLFQYEHEFQIASDSIFEAESSRFRDAEVYVMPEIVNRVSSTEVNFDNTDVIPSEFDDTADTFINIPVKNYPLIITFQKFLRMLDSILESSFFERFHKASEDCYGNYISSSVAMKIFIRSREVTFGKFYSPYWPHFNTNLTKKLDSSKVFTKIISHIKGGLLVGECSDGKVSYEGYCLLAESRSSTLTKEKMEILYNHFQAYEKMKTKHGEFNLGAFVNDVHRRLKNGNYKGFMFAGDTAKTIAKRINFRFQDIRSLFYKDFLSTRTSEMQETGFVSEIKQSKQNFRTHAGMLDLAQSVIDIMYHYYIQ
ncbi:UvrD-like helicase, ATP-binding domain, P-loop containing nucleoside triphosphate hydrolase [Tanacetum coccineum]